MQQFFEVTFDVRLRSPRRVSRIPDCSIHIVYSASGDLTGLFIDDYDYTQNGHLIDILHKHLVTTIQTEVSEQAVNGEYLHKTYGDY